MPRSRASVPQKTFAQQSQKYRFLEMFKALELRNLCIHFTWLPSVLLKQSANRKNHAMQIRMILPLGISGLQSWVLIVQCVYTDNSLYMSQNALWSPGQSGKGTARGVSVQTFPVQLCHMSAWWNNGAGSLLLFKLGNSHCNVFLPWHMPRAATKCNCKHNMV